jgi:hypothetical protein
MLLNFVAAVILSKGMTRSSLHHSEFYRDVQSLPNLKRCMSALRVSLVFYPPLISYAAYCYGTTQHIRSSWEDVPPCPQKVPLEASSKSLKEQAQLHPGFDAERSRAPGAPSIVAYPCAHSIVSAGPKGLRRCGRPRKRGRRRRGRRRRWCS